MGDVETLGREIQQARKTKPLRRVVEREIDGIALDRQYLRPHQVADLRSYESSLREAVANPAIRDKKGAVRQLNQVRGQLERESAPELGPEQRDRVAAKVKRIEDELPALMQTASELRFAPPGARGRLATFERRYKGVILYWKNAQLALNPGNSDPDLCNFERFRPIGARPANGILGARAFSFPSPSFQANYDETFGGGGEESTPEARTAAFDQKLSESLSRLDSIEDVIGRLQGGDAAGAAPEEAASAKARG